MRYGVILLWEDDVGVFQRRVRRVEELGFDAVGVGDSPGGYRELGVSLTVAVTETARALVASTVTVPVGRHPVVVASSFSALDELSGGRIVYAVGTGGSATGSMGPYLPATSWSGASASSASAALPRPSIPARPDRRRDVYAALESGVP